MPSYAKLLIGLAATALSAWLFHGPGGNGQRVIDRLDAQVQPIVARQELSTVTATFARDPLARDLRFSGEANDFQRERFVEIIQESQIRGLRSIAWAPPARPAAGAAR